ncbi:MAG: T9SS type A sorting domain-containing protein [Saprospiraceae bacterium]|nr:T9SS type A sorting domain-containing protein [Saprospiraceae bacterium]
MNKTFTLIFLLAFILQSEVSKACSCVYIGTFCETITYNNEEVSPYLCVIRGTVIAQESDRMKVRVVEHLGGTAPEGEEIFILSGNGANCAEFVGGFEIGKDFVFAMNIGWGENSDLYSLTICGVSYLRINNEVVEGKIAPGINSINYNKLGTIDDCGKLTIEQKIGLFSIFPNLTSVGPTISLDPESSDPVLIDWEVYSNIGQLLDEKNAQSFLPGEKFRVNMESYPPGVYLLRIRRSGERKVFKIVKI